MGFACGMIDYLSMRGILGTSSIVCFRSNTEMLKVTFRPSSVIVLSRNAVSSKLARSGLSLA